MTLTSGARIRKYELLEKVGEGGMGVVWKARDADLDRMVAIKVIHDQLALDPEIRKRFIDEARIQARLVHQNICTLFDAFDDNGTLFIVQEFVAGVSLKQKIEDAQGPLPIDQTVRIAGGVLAGLAHAHEEGVIHRDIKPANIMIDAKDRVKIMDFGIAKALGVERMGKTKTGMTVGTPEYMSPEQILGKDVDARSDIYSFGIMLYEMLTGTLPFDATSSEYEIQKFHVEGTLPPLDNLHSELSQMAALLQKCTAKNREERFSAASDILQCLHAPSQTIPLRPPPLPTVGLDTAEGVCPLCRSRYHMHKPKKLYGFTVCKKCRDSFATRRQIAYFLDSLIIIPFNWLLGFMVNLIFSALSLSPPDNVMWYFATCAVFSFKDGFSGYSLGKAICGVRVINRYTGQPAGFGASFLRNLPLNIPFMPLFVFVQLLWGHRVGDGWSSTKVIWKKYADHPIFAPEQR